jgi:hypothetical protein
MDEAAENIQARSAMRQALIEAAALSGSQYLEPAWVIRCNEFLWSRIDAGDRNYGTIAEDFREYVQGRCGIAH